MVGDPAPGVWGEGRRPARAIASDTLSDFGEGRIGYAALEWVERSLADRSRLGKKSDGVMETPAAAAPAIRAS